MDNAATTRKSTRTFIVFGPLHGPADLISCYLGQSRRDSSLWEGCTGPYHGQKSPVGPRGLGPCAAASHTCLPIAEALVCPSLACLMASVGTPQVRVFSSRLLMNLDSAARKFLNSLQA